MVSPQFREGLFGRHGPRRITLHGLGDGQNLPPQPVVHLRRQGLQARIDHLAWIGAGAGIQQPLDLGGLGLGQGDRGTHAPKIPPAAPPIPAESRPRHLRGPRAFSPGNPREVPMNNIVYIVGAVVIVIAILSFFGLR